MLTINVLKVADAAAVIQATMDANKARGVQEIGKIAARRRRRPRRPRRPRRLHPSSRSCCERGATIYSELCFACHGDDGRGAPMAGAPAGHDDGAAARRLAARAGPSRLRRSRSLLHGLTGPLDDKTYTKVMVPMGAQKDDWIAADRVATSATTSATPGRSSRRPTSRACARRRPTARRRGRSPEIEATLPVLLPSDHDVEGDGQPQPGGRRPTR